MSNPAEGDPFVRIKGVLADDMLRAMLYGRINSLIAEYKETFGALPLWVRISFDLVHHNGPPIFIDGDHPCGLEFRLELRFNNFIEVGASVHDYKNEDKNQTTTTQTDRAL